jgi:hypothetical protein
MTKKTKTQMEILIDGLKNLDPFYQGYVIDRLEKDIQRMRSELPDYFEQMKQDESEGKISMFHPNFFIHYVNSMTEIFNQIELNHLKRDGRIQEFQPTPKMDYLDQ